MGVFSLTNSSSRVDQAISAVHSGLFPNGSGIVYQSGDTSITGQKTFNGPTIFNGLVNASGVISGVLSPQNDGLVNLGQTNKRFATIYASGISGTTGYFGGNLVVAGTLTAASFNVSASPLANITVSGTGAFQNIRVTGSTLLNGSTTFSGAANFSGSNTYQGAQDFNGAVSFGSSSTIFENGFSTSGTPIFKNGFTSYGDNFLTGGVFVQSGDATMSGSMSHVGTFSNNGNLTQIGNMGVLGNLNVTGDFGLTGGSFTIRGSSFYTTGSPLDRFRVVQPVDVTGDLNITGSFNLSSNATILGTTTVNGTIKTNGTGYASGIRVSGELFSSGNNSLTGNNVLQGSNSIGGTTVISGDVTFSQTSTQNVVFNSYVRPYIIASGIGSNSVKTLALTNFWSTAGIALSPGTGIWMTSYTGTIGEIGLFLTGSNSSASNNNNLPVGTYGRVIQFVNAGVSNGSGVWSPIGY